MTHVAILVPGIMGSELRLAGQVVWPGPVSSLVLPYRLMTELLSDELVATDVIRSVSVSEQYGSLIDDLGTCGFRESDSPPTLFICPYDWRRDNRLAAQVLATVIDAAVDQHGKDTEISIIAHSMGGLVGRYYLESGKFDGRTGFTAVRRLILVATPHRGSPLAFTAALGMEKRLFLSAHQVRELASDPRYPALYQLLPECGEPFAWDEDPRSEFRAVDIYEPTVATALQLMAPNLQAAKEFHLALNASRRPSHARYFCFSGTRQTTISNVLLLRVDSHYRVRKIELDGAGDATVPAWSATLAGIQGQTVGGEHGTIYRNASLRRTLSVLLGKSGVLAASPRRVELSLRQRVTYPNETVQLVLAFPSSVREFSGELRLEWAQLNDDGQLVTYKPTQLAFPVSYAGLPADQLTVSLSAPATTGVYRVGFFPPDQATAAGYDELFVQASEGH